MDYFLTEEQVFMKDVARDLAQKKIKPVSAHYDEANEFPWPVVEAMAEADIFRVFIDEKYGGMAGGSPIMNMCVVTEELSKVDGGISLAFAATGLGTFPILVSASEEQKERWLPRIADGTIAAFGLTEANAGSNVAGIQTRAVEDGDSYIINGTKQWITNGGEADIYTVFAVTDPDRGPRGVSCFVVEKGTEGFSFGKKEDKMGIRASATRELVFQDCRVPKENMLGRRGTGFFTAMKTFDQSRPGVAAQALGIAQGALDYAIAYSRSASSSVSRSPVPGRAVHARRHGDEGRGGAGADLLRGGPLERADARREGTRPGSSLGVKCFASDVAMEVTTDAVQLFGGYGYIKDYPVERMMRDAKITQIYEGTNQIQRDEIGRGLIAEAARKKE